jgi:uncharacterized protein DUF4238
MAGKQHHHFWQMLQKGFAWQEYGDHHIWVYRKNSEPKQTVTRTFGRINSFYGPEGSEADKNITEFENSVQGFIQEVRKADTGQEIDRDISAAIVSHLEVRSLFLRDELSRVGERMLSVLQSYLASEKQAAAIFSAFARNHPEMIDDALEESGIPEEMLPLARQLAAQNLPKAIRNGADKMADIADMLFTPLLKTMTDTAKNAHNKDLEHDFTKTERTKKHKAMRYFIYRSNTGQLILPDTSLAFFKEKGCTPISQKGDNIESVFVPVSRHVAIVGKTDPAFEREIGTIQKVLASCAYEAFLAAERSDELKSLSSRISRNASLISDAELERNINFRNMLNL